MRKSKDVPITGDMDEGRHITCVDVSVAARASSQ